MLQDYLFCTDGCSDANSWSLVWMNAYIHIYIHIYIYIYIHVHTLPVSFCSTHHQPSARPSELPTEKLGESNQANCMKKEEFDEVGEVHFSHDPENCMKNGEGQRRRGQRTGKKMKMKKTRKSKDWWWVWRRRSRAKKQTCITKVLPLQILNR